MRRSFFCFLAVLLLVCSLFPAVCFGEGIRSGDYRYEELEDGIRITWYWGSEPNVVIPESIDGKTVRVIGQYCFANNEIIWSVTVPGTVHTIEDDAFFYSSVRQIDLPDSLKRLGEGAFFGSRLTALYVPSSVESVGEYLCTYCTNLRSVHFAASVEELPKAAFAACDNLRDVYLSDAIRHIGMDAFNTCLSLRQIHLPSGLLSLDGTSFAGVDLEQLNEDARKIIEDIYSVYEEEEYEDEDEEADEMNDLDDDD